MLWKQIVYYSYGIFKKSPKPFPIEKERKFNPLQQFSYIIAMYVLVPLIIISGIGLLFPEITIPKIFGHSGLWLTDLLHQIMGYALTLFWIIHLYFCTIGKTTTSNFRSMVDGWH
jgi:thiosulfate reductase cytochrome b subunit